jgi:hypothetical protein
VFKGIFYKNTHLPREISRHHKTLTPYLQI